jgi:hypothetical protein
VPTNGHVQVLLHLLNVSKEMRGSLGVITPYVAQLNLLNQELADVITAARSDQAKASTSASWSSLQPGGQQRQTLDTVASGTLNSITASGAGPPPPAAAAAAGGGGGGGPASSTALLPEDFYALSSDSDTALGDVVELKTVDGYQGREKEVVVFSAVRANAQAQVGYV